MNNWLIVERYENWLVDKQNGFRKIGFAKKKEGTIERFKKGDQLIIYIASGKSCIAGIREVLVDTPEYVNDLIYQEIYPIRIETRSITSLPEEHWIKIHRFIGKLSFTKNIRDWRQIFRHTIRELHQKDASILKKSIIQERKKYDERE